MADLHHLPDQTSTLTRVSAGQIIREGMAAGKAGKSTLDCPYSPTGDATERVKVQAWLHGYLLTRKQ